MPLQSKAQSALMHGIASGSIPERAGLPGREVAARFVAHSHGQRVRNLPEHVTPACAGRADGGTVDGGAIDAAPAYPPKFRW